METENFGEHLTIDGYGGDYKKLNDRMIVLRCLNEIPERTGMTKIIKPVILHANDNEIKDPGGWSGFVMIAESHISIHTFPARGFVSADVYTCKNGMDTEFIVKFISDVFELKDAEVNILQRGTKYPIKNIY